MRIILITAFAAAAVTLGACGQKGPLVAAPGATPPPAASTPPAPLPPGAQRPTDQAPSATEPRKR